MITGVLFLCTGNACRSQMAEGLARSVFPAGIRVTSAGTAPKGVDARAVVVMRELGLDIAGHQSKHLDTLDLSKVQLVVTLCGDAAELCPTLAHARREHWPVRDPAAAVGSEAEVMMQFRAIRDELVRRVTALATRLSREPAVGILGGSGFYGMAELSDARPLQVETPFGEPSGPLMEGRIGGRRVVFLARHGAGHGLLPSEVNARANIYALKRAGVSHLVSVSAVGSLRQEIQPGDAVLPDQFIDRTVGRPGTFFGRGTVAHVSLADPTCSALSRALAESVLEEGGRAHVGGTYLCIEGPQFSTRAESHLWRAYGADVVGMTGQPEARLAREAELCYATLAFSTDYDSWRPHDEVRVDDVLSVLRANVERAGAVLVRALAGLELAPCGCHQSLDAALLTPAEQIGPESRVRLHAILARRLGYGTKASEEST